MGHDTLLSPSFCMTCMTEQFLTRPLDGYACSANTRPMFTLFKEKWKEGTSYWDHGNYRGTILKCILVKYDEWCWYSPGVYIESRPICNHSNTFLGFYAMQGNSWTIESLSSSQAELYCKKYISAAFTILTTCVYCWYE